MSSGNPEVGQLSADGLFEWDGQDWAPLARARREPTSWTRPLQLSVAGFLVLDAVQSIVTTALFLNMASAERASRAQNPSITADQLHAAASLAVGLGWAVVIALTLVRVILAASSVRGWRWAFWVTLVWLALGSIGVATNLVELANSDVQTMPPGAVGVGLLFAVLALALLAWFVAAAVRYGPWAMRKPDA
jgi:hypothetical protein